MCVHYCAMYWPMKGGTGAVGWVPTLGKWLWNLQLWAEENLKNRNCHPPHRKAQLHGTFSRYWWGREWFHLPCSVCWENTWKAWWWHSDTIWKDQKDASQLGSHGRDSHIWKQPITMCRQLLHFCRRRCLANMSLATGNSLMQHLTLWFSSISWFLFVFYCLPPLCNSYLVPFMALLL